MLNMSCSRLYANDQCDTAPGEEHFETGLMCDCLCAVVVLC